uniref:Uncharacterized protein n=2 Tax=Bacteria TaxID=2 RepID=E0XSD6_9ACTN|nr:hypothetical protein [uncultured actinobacterium HF0070_17F14]ADI17415.1 hypothetical protein [uncultured Verrucomicrobiales bacterium HF0070_30L02]
MSEDTGLDARARYAILKKLNATMPPTQGRGQRLRRDYSLKAEETNAGQVVPTKLRFRRTGAFREGSGRVTSA